MTGERNPLTDGLLQAIKAENDGYHFYMMAARSTEDPKGRGIFEQLAGEEKSHVRFLERQYRSLIETGKIDVTATLGQPMELGGLHPIFSDEIKSRARDAHYEMTALSIGIKLELEAVEFYRREAGAHDDPGVREFYLQLVEWEQGHYNALLKQHDALKEDYWSAGGFSPY